MTKDSEGPVKVGKIAHIDHERSMRSVMSDESKIKAGLRQYWRHDDDCHVTAKGDDAPCSCGARVTLLAIEATLTEARAQGAAEERERLIRLAEGERPPKVFWGDGLDSTGRRADIPLAAWLRFHAGEG